MSDNRNRRAARVPCPTCGAMHGLPCRPLGKGPLPGGFHPSRRLAGDRAAMDARNSRSRSIRGTLSVSREFYAELRAAAVKRGQPVGGLCEAMIIDALNAEAAS